MPYVKRDASGRIVAVFHEPLDGATEEVEAGDPELLLFVGSAEGGEDMPAQQALQVTDLDLVRVIEDLIDVLIDKGTIMLTDLPEAARAKIMLRSRLRDRVNNLGRLLGEDDPFL